MLQRLAPFISRRARSAKLLRDRVSGANGLDEFVGHLFHRSSAWNKKHGSKLQRCGQPGQQHGLRMPSRILSRPTSMRHFRVSSFLADVTQQIHSFRASGVIVPQRFFAAASDSMALRKSAGSLWTMPFVVFLVAIRQFVNWQKFGTPGKSSGHPSLLIVSNNAIMRKR
jgi:hypothetical protein